MVAAITKLGWSYFSYFGHNLNLGVTNAMKEEDRIIRAVGVFKKVVQHFAHTQLEKNSRTEAQVVKGLPHHMVVTDCPTRWGSQHKMISWILKQDVAMHMILSYDRKTTHLIPT